MSVQSAIGNGKLRFPLHLNTAMASDLKVTGFTPRATCSNLPIRGDILEARGRHQPPNVLQRIGRKALMKKVARDGIEPPIRFGASVDVQKSINKGFSALLDFRGHRWML